MLALALPFNACFGQEPEPPQKPRVPQAPKPPAAPLAPPAPDLDANVAEMQGLKERAMEIANEARNTAREWQGGVYQRLQNVIARSPAPSRSLIIPKDAADVKTMAENEEDLNIMARLLDKVASSPDGTPRRAMGISVRTSFDGGSPRNLYIDGYGAIFFLNVSYPLSEPPVNTEKTEAKPEPPSEWDEARRELYQPGKGQGGNSPFEYKLAEIASPSSEPYDAEKVEQLQKNLIMQLKNASHIRGLKSDETVTLMVSGPSGGPGTKVVVKKMYSNSGSSTSSSSSSGTITGGGSGGGQGGGFVGGTSGRPPGAELRGNQMLLRARKADIEAFQNDKLSYDEFRKKVTVLIY